MSKFIKLFELTTTMSIPLTTVSSTIIGKKKEEEDKVQESCSDCSKMSDHELRKNIKIMGDQLRYMSDTDTYWGSSTWEKLSRRLEHLKDELASRTKRKSNPPMFKKAFA